MCRSALRCGTTTWNFRGALPSAWAKMDAAHARYAHVAAFATSLQTECRSAETREIPCVSSNKVRSLGHLNLCRYACLSCVTEKCNNASYPFLVVFAFKFLSVCKRFACMVLIYSALHICGLPEYSQTTCIPNPAKQRVDTGGPTVLAAFKTDSAATEAPAAATGQAACGDSTGAVGLF